MTDSGAGLEGWVYLKHQVGCVGPVGLGGSSSSTARLLSQSASLSAGPPSQTRSSMGLGDLSPGQTQPCPSSFVCILCLLCALRGLGRCGSTESSLSPTDRQSDSLCSRESWMRNVPLIHGIYKMYQQQECDKDTGIKGRADARCQGLCI